MLVVCAPSGTGKSTLIGRLTDEFPELAFSVSCTTRPMRPGERDGREYHFLSRPEFEDLRDRGGFAEWAEVYGNLYGTPKERTLTLLLSGRDLLFDIDVQGAEQLRQNLDRGVFVFVFPPSLRALRERLEKRGLDDEATIAKRLAAAPAEIARAGSFDYWIVNDELDRAYRDLKSVYMAERLRPSLRPELPDIVSDLD
jgi:guanylate kinase